VVCVCVYVCVWLVCVWCVRVCVCVGEGWVEVPCQQKVTRSKKV